ncbi:MAG: hypothetical protein ACE5MM_03965 [Nitrospiraceae bacterium]
MREVYVARFPILMVEMDNGSRVLGRYEGQEPPLGNIPVFCLAKEGPCR